uniref:Uncharacterized protein n=1 Tax=Timema shepardi TaxID=629360 RepID=A0A7R9ASX9_TIMSH|nr:unnamed protein product [Timema shepardi]
MPLGWQQCAVSGLVLVEPCARRVQSWRQTSSVALVQAVDNATASRCHCRRRVFDDGGAVPRRVVVMLLVETMSGTYTNSHRDGLRLRLSDPTLGTSLLSGGSLGSEDSEEEGVEGSRGGGRGVTNWTWTHRTVPPMCTFELLSRGLISYGSAYGYIIWSGSFSKPSALSCELSVSTKEVMGLLY